MHKKLLAVVASGAVAASLFAPGAQAATRKKTTTKKKAAPKAAPTTKAPAPTTVAAATATAPKASAYKSGGTLINVGTFSSGDPTTAGDPALSSVVNESQVANMLFDGLMEIDYDSGELKPNVAEAFPAVSGGTLVTFKIRKGVKFSNGEDVLPSSFKCAWDRVLQPAIASPLGYHFEIIEGATEVEEGKAKSISGVKADDAAMTLSVQMKSPYADFIAETQHTVFSPLTKAGCAAGRNYHDGLMIGNGPFKLAEPWKRAQYIKVVRSETYWGGINQHPAYLDGVEFKIVKDELAALNVFESGQADVTGTVAGRFTELTKKYGDTAAKRNQLVIQYFGFNWEDPKVGGFANAKLRQAISLSIDRKRINDAIFDGSRKEATGFTPPGITGVKPDAYGLNPTANVDAAKKLMTEYGKDPGPIKLRIANTPANVNIATIIKNSVKTNIDVDLIIEADNPTGYFDRLRSSPGQAFRAGWAADFTGYDNFMSPLFSSNAIGGDNLFKFSNTEVDKLIEEARGTTDTNKRNAIYQKAESIILGQGVAVPLWWNKWSTILSSKVNAESFAKAQGPTAFVDYAEVAFK
jgi:oligopeptide transport system substrate-binding protein